MDSYNKFISHDGLPEIYTIPSQSSKNILKRTLNKSKVWDRPILTSASKAENEKSDIITYEPRPDINISSSYNLPMGKNNLESDVVLMNKFQKENGSKVHDEMLNNNKAKKESKRGETPGSDSPRDFLIALTNLKLDYKLKDDVQFNSGKTNESELTDSSHRQAVEGADSQDVIPLASSMDHKEKVDIHMPPSISSSEIELNLLCRKSPAGVSTPETFSNNASTDNDYAISTLQEDNNLSIRPPVLGYCEASDIPKLVSRKDLGSTDGEDSSNESVRKSATRIDQNKTKILMEPYSVGSQSENTDSNSTVLDMKKLSIQGYENEFEIFTGMNNLLEPNFLVGGPISPCIVDSCNTVVDERSLKPIAKETSTYASLVKINSRNDQSEQEDSLISLVSAESTHHPESSECITPPSVACMSISSIASSKKLEWDSAADVGYNRKSFELKDPSLPADSLSTLERIAIGSYAAMMRTEPEGTTNTSNKLKFANKNKIFLKQKHKNVGKHKGFDRENNSLIVNSGKLKADYSTSEDNGDSSVTKKIIGHKNPQNKNFNDKCCSQFSQLKKKSISSSGMYYSKSELKNCVCKDNGKYSFDTLQSDNDGQALKNRFLDLKCFQSNKITSAASLPFHSISNACRGPTVYTQKSHSLQTLNFNDIKNNSCKEDDLDLIAHGLSSDNNSNDILSSFSNSQNVALSENLNSVKIVNSNSSTKSEGSYTENYSNSSSIYNSSSLSLSSINNVLCSFSYKLKEYVLSLKNNGSFSNLNDFDKLQDYIDFVGVPSTNDEEVQLKQSVADIIMRMFSDISKSDCPSLLLNTDIKSLKRNRLSSNASSLKSDMESLSCKDSNEKMSHVQMKPDTINHKQTPVNYIPYRPSMSSRTYFIATSDDKVKNFKKQCIKATTPQEVPNSCLRNFSENDRHGGLDNSPILVSDSILHKDLESGLHEDLDTSFQNISQNFIDIANAQNSSLNSSCKGVYQDRHGTLHVAHQPPGYNSNFDSHFSESLSDNDVNKVTNGLEDENFRDDDTLPTIDQRRGLPAALSSTGSESAYETIRERHQNIGEALASSFEFYSTSPRDARALGYVTSDTEKQKQIVIQNIEASLCPRVSDVAKPSVSSSKSTDGEFFSSTDSYQQQQYVPRKYPKKSRRKSRSTKKSMTHSSIAESDEVSSNISLVQIQRQRYVRRFKNYIHTLKKLERNLMPPSIESSLLSERPMTGASESSCEKSRTYFPNDAVLDNVNVDCTLPISSEDHSSNHKFSSDGVDNSLIIHCTSSDSSSIASVNASNGFISSNLSSSLSSPRHTSTLCKDRKRIKKSKNTNCNFNVDSNLKSCGKILDFRKLMSSTSAPGEKRPIRYLLQSENFKGIDSCQNKSSEKNSFPKKTEEKINKIDFKNSEEPLGEVVESGHPLKFCMSTHGIIKEGTIGGKRNVEKGDTKILESGKTDMQMVDASPNDQLKVIFKETQDFCQMYPSSSSLNIYGEESEIPIISQAVGTQTNEAEISTDIVDKPIDNVSKALTNDHNIAVADGTLNFKPDKLSVINQGQCHISLLDQMEAKIKDNTNKINLALEDYNKQFGPLTSENILGKVYESKLPSITKQKYAKLCTQKEFCQSKLISKQFESLEKEEMSICGSIIDTRIDKPLESFATVKNGMKFVVNADSKVGSKESLNKSLAEELIELNKEKEIMTLQEALALARPSYIKDAEKRRIKICRKQTLRRELQEHNQSVLAQLPDNLKTPTVLRKFLYQPDESPLFNYKAMREQNKRLYQMLPEAQKTAILQKKESKSKVQRLMASYYSQKLKGKVLSGKVSHAHRNIVTPIR